MTNVNQPKDEKYVLDFYDGVTEEFNVCGNKFNYVKVIAWDELQDERIFLCFDISPQVGGKIHKLLATSKSTITDNKITYRVSLLKGEQKKFQELLTEVVLHQLNPPIFLKGEKFDLAKIIVVSKVGLEVALGKIFKNEIIKIIDFRKYYE